VTPSQLENWVLSVLDRVRAHRQTEDIRVEVKTNWPTEIAKAARRIAAHANAAMGEPILWIIGADEKSGLVTGAEQEELANWWPQIQSQFDGIAPDLMDLVVPTESTTVVALLFDTTRAPFVVKNPDGGTIQWEVPWREGTGVRSARRSDLIRLLVPLQQVPEVEIRQARLAVYKQDTKGLLAWSLWLELYLVPLSGERIVIPFHRCRGVVTVPGFLPETSFAITLAPGAESRIDGQGTPSLTIGGGNTELLIEGPGSAYVRAFFYTDVTELQPTDTALVRVTMQPVHASAPAVVEAKLTLASNAGATTLEWKYAPG